MCWRESILLPAKGYGQRADVPNPNSSLPDLRSRVVPSPMVASYDSAIPSFPLLNHRGCPQLAGHFKRVVQSVDLRPAISLCLSGRVHLQSVRQVVRWCDVRQLPKYRLSSAPCANAFGTEAIADFVASVQPGSSRVDFVSSHQGLPAQSVDRTTMVA